jgi:DNA-binding GntR family transcriptional regulator
VPAVGGSFGGRANLKEDAAAYLREQILTGRLRPGQKIAQDEVAQTLGISRLPVREALIELSQDGLVDTPPRRGAFVAQLERQDVLDHYLIYGLVSGIAAERAATTTGHTNMESLRSIHERLRSGADPASQEELNFQFHRIINAAGSGRLRAVLRLFLRSLPIHYYEFAPAWGEQAIDHHERILVALEAGDGPSARAAMEGHLLQSGRHAIAILEQIGFWSDTDEQPTGGEQL